MKIGFLFPGQGTQSLGMGKDLYDNFAEYKNIYEKVKEISNIDVSKITFEDEKKLNQTKYAQICILTMSMAILELLKKDNIEVDMAAGLSLGEYSALIYSGKISFEDGIKLVKKRGEYMQNLVPEGEYLMASIIGLEEDSLKTICQNIKSGYVAPVNFNLKTAIAISGEKQAVLDAMEEAKKLGAKKTVILKTSGPFHTKFLKDASIKLKEELEKINFNKFERKVVKNIDAKIYNDQDNMPDILSKHIVSPVRFYESIDTMINEGIDTFIEVGPRKTLTTLVKRINENVNTFYINDKTSLEETIKQIKIMQNA